MKFKESKLAMQILSLVVAIILTVIVSIFLDSKSDAKSNIIEQKEHKALIINPVNPDDPLAEKNTETIEKEKSDK